MNVLITGHSRGLGAALATHYLAQGARVFGLSRRRLPEASNLTQGTCDFADIEAVAPALAELCGDAQALDLVFLNAGVLGPIADLHTTPVATLAEVMTINTWANKVILDWLAARKSPPQQIIAISSGAALNGPQGWGAYATSKAALNMLIQLYAYELPSSHLTALAPGLIDTDMQAELRAVDRAAFPSVARVQDAHGTPAMPDAAAVARRIASALPSLRAQPSGSYVDLRNLAEA